MRTSGSWPERSGERGVALVVCPCGRGRNGAAGGLRDGESTHWFVIGDSPPAAGGGAADRPRAALSSPRDRSGGRCVSAPTGCAVRGARRGVRGQPGGDRAGRHRGDSTYPPVGGPRLLRGLLRQPGDARADGSGARASWHAAGVVASVSWLGCAAVHAAAGVVQSAFGRPRCRVSRRSPLAR